MYIYINKLNTKSMHETCAIDKLGASVLARAKA